MNINLIKRKIRYSQEGIVEKHDLGRSVHKGRLLNFQDSEEGGFKKMGVKNQWGLRPLSEV